MAQWPNNAQPDTDRQTGGNADSMVWTAPTGVLVNVESVVATIDTSGGSGSRPRITVRDPSGVIIAETRANGTIPSGTTDRATWSLRLTDDTSGFLHWGTNEDTNFEGLILASGGPAELRMLFDEVLIAAAHDMTLQTTAGDIVAQVPGGAIITLAHASLPTPSTGSFGGSANWVMSLNNGKTFKINDHNGNPLVTYTG